MAGGQKDGQDDQAGEKNHRQAADAIEKIEPESIAGDGGRPEGKDQQTEPEGQGKAAPQPLREPNDRQQGGAQHRRHEPTDNDEQTLHDLRIRGRQAEFIHRLMGFSQI